MAIDPELLQRFFENKCEPEERDYVMKYLSQHPEAEEEFFPVEEWNENINTNPLPEEDIVILKQNIRDQVFPLETAAHKKRVFIINMWGKVAAAIILFVAGIWWLRYELPRHSDRAKMIASIDSSAGGKTTVANALTWTIQTNNTNQPASFRLPDGSNIRLEPHASFRYSSDYGIKNRHIYAEGAAFFQVVKDRNKPFTVFAGSLQTTALGTSFKVTTTSRRVVVKLITGKVVVKSSGDVSGWKENVILNPGDVVSYDNYLAVAKVDRRKSETDRSTNGNANINKDISEIAFNNTPMHEVLEKLSAMHHRKIIYDARDMTGKNFTGTISNSDSLIVVLRFICTMNDLEVKEAGNSCTITKAVP